MADRNGPAEANATSRWGLRPDGGWADAASVDLSAVDRAARDRWGALFDHLAQAKPRGAHGDWAQAQHEVGFRCLSAGDSAIPGGVTVPGTAGYRDALLSAAPDDAWIAQAAERLERAGGEAAIAVVGRWYLAATRSKVGLNRPGLNRDMLRALLWLAAAGSPSPPVRQQLLDRMRQLAASSAVAKTPHPVTAGIVLGVIESEESAAALRLLEQSAKRPTPRTRFGRLADHVERRQGIDPATSAERFVPDFGFASAGMRRIAFGETAHADVRIAGRDVVVQWSSGGRAVKSVPAAVRRDHAAPLKELRAVATGAEKMLTAQRDRLDSLMALSTSWEHPYWRRHYFDHPIVGALARRLIWVVDGVPVLCVAGGVDALGDVRGEPISPGDASVVALWHPADQPAEEILAWRKRIERLEVTQPFKQAHREVYALTDAERTTRTYSNRFAAHILRQHQMKALALSRGWSYELQGPWDGGSSSSARRPMPQYDLLAELWTEGADGAAGPDGNSFSNAGIYLFVVTDRVRFHRLSSANLREGRQGQEPLPLDQVPPLVLSEVMRDVDLFVGVASVGNDSNWQDGGPEARFRTYWRDYSFGEIAETARTRKAVLETLLPRLTKLHGRWELTDRFLVVRGEVRTYKIHLGSGNILMEPNDQYLCIVPDRSTKPDSAGGSGVFLPFEGDATLSIILSKAFLLAEDRKIKDPTITRQIAGA